MINIPYVFRDPYSVKGLRRRAERLKDCPYKLFLNMASDQLERKKVNRDEVKKAIEYVRTGDPNLLAVAIKMLRLNQAQIDIALNLTRKMRDKH